MKIHLVGVKIILIGNINLKDKSSLCVGGGGNLTPFFSQCDKTLYNTHNVLSHPQKKYII